MLDPALEQLLRETFDTLCHVADQVDRHFMEGKPLDGLRPEEALPVVKVWSSTSKEIRWLAGQLVSFHRDLQALQDRRGGS